MVSNEKERRGFPAFALARIRELAAKERVIYRSPRVEQDVGNLGYSLEDVCSCIASLEDRHFQHSERPADQKFWQDVYHCQWSSVPGVPDALYIKLMLTPTTITVVLCSLHLHR